MEIKITTNQVLKILYVLSWIIFVGVCIEAGGFIFNAFYAMELNPIGAKHFWEKIDLSGLYKFDRWQFFAETIHMIIPSVLKACLFYLVIKMLHDKRLNMSRPFSNEMGRFIFNLSYLALGIGLFSWWGASYTEWLIKQGVQMPDIQTLRLAGGDVWLFMGVTLYVIAQIFKRGIEIQTENDLTV